MATRGPASGRGAPTSGRGAPASARQSASPKSASRKPAATGPASARASPKSQTGSGKRAPAAAATSKARATPPAAAPAEPATSARIDLNASNDVDPSSLLPQLVLDRSIGFDGLTAQALRFHPNGEFLLYPLGSTVVVREMGTSEQYFYQGPAGEDCSCVVISPSGALIAAGHETHIGYKSTINVWDFESGTIKYTLKLHKGKVQDLAFSPNEQYLVSLGGEDDNSVVVWDLTNGRPICGAPASSDSSGNAHCLEYFNNDENKFVTGGKHSLRVWDLDMGIRKIRPTDCKLGQLKRVVTAIQVESDDQGMYCATTTGDILHVNLNTNLFREAGPKTPFARGATAVVVSSSSEIVAGAGDGTLVVLERGTFKQLRKVVLDGGVTSIAWTAAANWLFVGTTNSNIYLVNYDTLEAELRSTSHPTRINDVSFPYDYSEVFATAGPAEVRLWNARTTEELLRISVPNLNCNCVAFTRDGGSVITGWDDGTIRAFGPETGTQQFVINNAHHGGVTAIVCTADNGRIVSGGTDGEVRIWKLLSTSQVLETTMKQHKGAVSSLQLRSNDLECVSSSVDGSCILWDLVKGVRAVVFLAPCLFRQIRIHPEESQVITCGSDRKIGFWDMTDGTAIRELEMPADCPINSIDIFADGERFVSGGNEKVVQMWSYDHGAVVATGIGHSGNIVKVVVSPDQQSVVSISEEGAVLIWSVPPM